MRKNIDREPIFLKGAEFADGFFPLSFAAKFWFPVSPSFRLENQPNASLLLSPPAWVYTGTAVGCDEQLCLLCPGYFSSSALKLACQGKLVQLFLS